MARVVCDTNVIISAYEFGGTPARVIDKAVAGEISMAISDPIMDEVRRVLTDKFHWPRKLVTELESVLNAYTRKVHPTLKLNVIAEDPPDNRILECAQAAEADYLITGDKDLLRLQQFGNTRILTPADFLRGLEQQIEQDR